MVGAIHSREEAVSRKLEEEVDVGERYRHSDIRIERIKHALGGMQDNRSQRFRKDLWHRLTTLDAGAVVHEECTSVDRLEFLYPL